MSVTYPQFDGTNFPDQIDSFPKVRDVTISMRPYAQEFQDLVDRGNLNEAAQLLKTYPELEETVINAAKLNRLQDALQAIETYYMTDVETYIINCVQFLGTWTPDKQYHKYNIVMYPVNGIEQAFMALSLDIPLGLPPLSSSLWIPITIRGEKGDKGDQGIQGIQGIQGEKGDTGDKGDKGDQGLQGIQGIQGPQGEVGPRGPQGLTGKDGLDGRDGLNLYYAGYWDQNITYSSQDLVTYNNCLWKAKHNGVTTTPSDTNVDDWFKMLEGVSAGAVKTILDLPEQKEVLTYNRYQQQPTWKNYIPGTVAISGITQAKDAGVYETIFTPNVNVQWSDGSNGPKVVEWEIKPMVITEIPRQLNELIYNGLLQSPEFTNYLQEELTITGQLEAIEAGKYEVTFTCNQNYIFDFGNFVRIAPSQNNTLVYNGTEQRPTFSNFNTEELSISGETSGVEAGEYDAIFTVKDGYTLAIGKVPGEEFE